MPEEMLTEASSAGEMLTEASSAGEMLTEASSAGEMLNAHWSKLCWKRCSLEQEVLGRCSLKRAVLEEMLTGASSAGRVK